MVDKVQRLKELEKQNNRLKRLLAERMLENDLLKELLQRSLTMAAQRQAVAFLVAGGLSVPRACTLVHMARSTFRYLAQPRDESELLAQIREAEARNPRYGYRRISVLLRRTTRINQKRVRRLRREERLQVQRVRRRRVRPPRPAHLAAAYPGHIWAYDFVEDALADGTPLRILTVMDEFTFLRLGHRCGADDLGRTRYRYPDRARRPVRCANLPAQRQWG